MKGQGHGGHLQGRFSPNPITGLTVLGAVLLRAGQAPALDVQAHREKTIDVPIEMGYMTKVAVKGGQHHMWVTPAFMFGDHHNQQSVAALVWHYFRDINPKYEKVILLLDGSETKVGVFSKEHGGLRMFHPWAGGAGPGGDRSFLTHPPPTSGSGKLDFSPARSSRGFHVGRH